MYTSEFEYFIWRINMLEFLSKGIKYELSKGEFSLKRLLDLDIENLIISNHVTHGWIAYKIVEISLNAFNKKILFKSGMYNSIEIGHVIYIKNTGWYKNINPFFVRIGKFFSLT